jgi:hypothetical protein
MIQSEEARMPWCHGRGEDQWKQKRRELVGALGEVLRRGQRQALVREDLKADTLAMLLLGVLRTRGRALREGGTVMDDETLVDFFLNGAGRHRVAPPLAGDG